jgi:hypothetical protein
MHGDACGWFGVCAGAVQALCRFWAWRAGLQSTHAMESSFRAYIQCMCLQRESSCSKEKAFARVLHTARTIFFTYAWRAHTPYKALCTHACNSKLQDAGQVLGGNACDVAASLTGRGCRFSVCVCRCVCLLCPRSSSRARCAGRGRGR